MADYIATKPDYTTGVWAEQGELSQPSADKIETGHIVEKPPFQLANWIENRQDQGIYYLFQNGLSTWQNNMFYPLYAIVVRNGVVYQALQQNTGQDPLSATDYWVKAFYSKTDGDSLKAIVDKIQNDDGFLSYYVKKSDPVMDAVAKGTGYAFKDKADTGLFLDANSNPIIKKSGQETHSFEKIKDVGSEDNDKVVTMADLKKAIGKLQPFAVGSIYINTGNNPNSDLGYGTWEKFGQGKTLVGQSDSGDDPNWVRSVGQTYGEYNHKLTEDEIPEHNHSKDNIYNKFTAIAQDVINKYGFRGISTGLTPSGVDNGGTNSELMVADFKEPYVTYATAEKIGADKEHNNVQPSIVVTFWKRTS